MRRLRIPTEIADSGRDILRAQLRRIFNSGWRGIISREECLKQGLDQIELHYKQRMQKIREYIQRRKLMFPDDAEDYSLMLDAKMETEQRWRRVCADMR